MRLLYGRKDALTINSTVPWHKRLLARFYHLRGQVHRHWGNSNTDLAEHELAVDDFTRAIACDPNYAAAYFSRGVLYWRELRNMYRAIRDLTRVLELDPGCAEALFNRAIAHQMRGDHAEAIADFQLYLQEGHDSFWLDSAARQLDLLQQVVAERDARGPSA